MFETKFSRRKKIWGVLPRICPLWLRICTLGRSQRGEARSLPEICDDNYWNLNKIVVNVQSQIFIRIGKSRPSPNYFSGYAPAHRRSGHFWRKKWLLLTHIYSTAVIGAKCFSHLKIQAFHRLSVDGRGGGGSALVSVAQMQIWMQVDAKLGRWFP